MPKKPMDEDRLRRKQELERKREARRAAREQEARQKAEDEKKAPSAGHEQRTGASGEQPASEVKVVGGAAAGKGMILELPEVAVHGIFKYLAAADLARFTMSCRAINLLLPDARGPILISRLNRPNRRASGRVGFVDMCRDESEANAVVERSYGGGNTGRVLPRGKFAKKGANDFVSYSRFVEEAVCGYGTLSTGARDDPIGLPKLVEGRFASVSPEHSLCRRGGDGQKSGGGSGLASWGVGRRGQLGHGRREDERKPRMLMGGIGYGIRIVQVSAGGGLVRVAHSLLLTSTGRVLSFGTGQYGALGHGYSAAKQLPDVLRPKYVEALNGIRVVCVSAGELHSACVTSDGDVYSWGDGFCGQLGHGDKRPQVTPKQLTQGGIEDESVSSISCGSRHTIFVTEDGEAFSCGLGHFGCLGRSFTPFEYDADTAIVNFPQLGGAHGEVPEALAAAQQQQQQEEEEEEEDAEPAIPPPPAAERDFAAELAAHIDLIANLSLDDSSDQCIPMIIDSLKGIKIVGASAGHRHTLLLDENGSLYSCGAGHGGCLGHGDSARQMHPMKIAAFDEENVKVMQMSAGVDMSMAVTTNGYVYAWGIPRNGRLGLGNIRGDISQPRRVHDGPVKAVDVECGYVHSLIVGLDGTLYEAGGVGVDGEADGQHSSDSPGETNAGKPRQVADFNIWHRVPEPKETLTKQERWKKFGKYEVKGRSKMMNEL